MSQVFLSYAREDQDRAQALAGVLAARGFSVWWDRALLPGRSFEDDIERELQAAQVVVVLWSRSSAASAWVRNEAAEGMKRGVLVPARLDATTIPLAFRGLETADLSGWTGGGDHGELGRLIDSVGRILDSRPDPAGSAAPVQPAARLQRLPWLEGLVVRVAIALAAGLTFPWAPPPGGFLIAVAMVGVSALAVWARRQQPLGRALLGLEAELVALAVLFAAGITLGRGASPWTEWPVLVEHFWPVLLRGWTSLALLAAVGQWVTARFVGTQAGPLGARRRP